MKNTFGRRIKVKKVKKSHAWSFFYLQVSNTTREMFRRDCGDKLTEITHSSGVDLWFVVKKELSASSVSNWRPCGES